MKIQWLRHWVRKPTLGIWAYQNRGDTTQKQAIVQFCADHNVHDLWVGSSNPDSYHDMISLVIKQEKFISTREIDSLLMNAKTKAHRFLHLAVNKFLVYSESDSDRYLDTEDYDLRLIKHWSDVIDLQPVYLKFNSNDCGECGNWIYPITNVIWNVNKQIRDT